MDNEDCVDIADFQSMLVYKRVLPNVEAWQMSGFFILSKKHNIVDSSSPEMVESVKVFGFIITNY